MLPLKGFSPASLEETVSMSDAWYCKIAGEERGPLSAQDLKALAADGQLAPEDLVRHGVHAAWVTAGRVRGLFPSAGSSAARPIGAAHEAPPAQAAKARPVAKPVVDSRSPAASQDTALSQPPVRKAQPSGVAPGGGSESAPWAPPRGQPATTQGEFDFLEEAYAMPPRPTAPGTKSPTSELMEKKRQLERRNMTILLAVLVGLMIVLGILMTVLFFKQRRGNSHQEPTTPAAEAADPASKPAEGPSETEKAARAAKNEAAKTPGEAKTSKTTPEVLWADASKQGAAVGDITVRVISAALARRKTKAGPERRVLEINLQLSNAQKGKKREYQSWAGRASGVNLVDDLGNVYRLLGGAESGASADSIYHEEPVRDTLFFERPVQGAKYLRLTLPGSAFGEKRSARIEIPMSMLANEASAPGNPQAGSVKRPGENGRAAKARASGAAPVRRAAADGPTGDPKEDLGIDADSAPPGPATPWSTIPDPPAAKPDAAKGP